MNSQDRMFKSTVKEEQKTGSARHVMQRKIDKKAEKTVSCSELTSQYSKGNSCSDLDNNAHLFFNEKGWPVKVISLTEDSPPKALKPWPSRSLPSPTTKKSPRKEKSIHTLRKPSSVTKSSKENKENKTNAKVKETVSCTDRNFEIDGSVVENDVQDEKQKALATLNSDIKTVLDRLDKTVEKFTDIKKPSDEEKGEKIVPKKPLHQTQRLKLKRNNKEIGQNTVKSEQKESTVCSARSNKYDSKEMKAYIHAKRTERKLQMSEEAKKKQEMMDLQRKKLETLRERALKVLKKSSKSVEESKPKWQGPLGEDNSEESQAAGILMFESKIPVAKKSKLSIKSDTSDVDSQVKLDNQVVSQDVLSEEGHKSDVTMDLRRNTHLNKIHCEGIPQSVTTNSETVEKKKSSTKLRLTKNKFQLEDLQFACSLEKPATDLISKEGININSNKIDDFSNKNLGDNSQNSPPLPNNWSLKKLQYSDLNTSPQSINLDQRRTFDIPFPTLYSPTVHSCPDNGFRKRQQSSSPKSNNIPMKKICTNDKVQPVQEVAVQNNVAMLNALKEVQERISKIENEGNGPEWLQTVLKQDAFNVLNMVQMKNMLSHQKRDSLGTEKKERFKQKVISVSNRSSIAQSDDETDAPSIESLEEDYKILPNPLRLSDIQLPIPNSNSSSAASFPWSSQSLETNQINNKKLKMKIIKTSTSFFTREAPPLVLPDSVQHLKLQSSVSQITSSISNPVQSSLGSVCSVISDKTSSSLEKRKPVSPVPLSSSSKNSCDHMSIRNNEDDKNRLKPTVFNGQIEIGQVLSSAALLLQFHAELNRLDAFDQSLAQVIAAERLYHTPVRRPGFHKSSRAALFDKNSETSLHGQNGQSFFQALSTDMHITCQKDASFLASECDTSTRSSMSHNQGSEVPVSEHLVSEHVPSLVSEHLPSLETRSLESLRHSTPSYLPSVEEIFSNKESVTDGLNEESQKTIPPGSSISAVHLSYSPKNLHVLKVLIEDAEFQRKQHQLFYKIQEDILQANYKASLTELDLQYSGSKGAANEDALRQESDARAKKEEHFKTTMANIRESKNQVLSNWSRRIEDLKRERNQLKKQIKTKSIGLKLRSAEASPKKQTPLRCASVTSVVESSSSSEASVMTQAFEEKKRQEMEKEKVSMYNRRKLEKELLKKYQEEMKLHELARERLLLASGGETRSRRDKSTSPLQSILQANTRDVGCSITEDNQSTSQLVTSSKGSIEEARTTDVYNSESFESPESSETPRQPRVINRPTLANKPFVAARPNSKSKVLIKVPLSPRLQFRNRHRCSSGSDESLMLSQNETQSEQSDYEYEVRILALKEQKRQRSAELSRLHRELKRVQREQQKATEESLIKQINVYDSYIAQTKKQLDELTSTPVVRPQIKHPRVSDRFLPSCTSDVSQKKTVVEDLSKQQDTQGSDVESNSLKSVSEASSTETTIQSLGQTQVTEQTSPQSGYDIDEISKSNVLDDNEIPEVLSSVPTESLNTVESQASNVSEESIKSPHSSPRSEERLSENWVDAELFFNQLGPLNNTSNDSNKTIARNDSNIPLVSNENKLTPAVDKKDLVNINTSNKIVESSSSDVEVIETEHESNSGSPKSAKNTASLENSGNDFVSTKIESTVNELNVTENLDVGSVVSIISQAPSNTPKFDGSDIQVGDIDSSTTSSVVAPKSDNDALASENDLLSSSLTNDKSIISEHLSLDKSQSSEDSESSALNVPSQPCIEEENKSDSSQVQSDVDESNESDEMIKVFVSSKRETNLDKSPLSERDDIVELNKTFTVSKDSENSYEVNDNESKAEKITDFILSKLLNECFLSNDNITKVISSTTVPAVQCDLDNHISENNNVTQESEISVDDFTKTVLNKFLQDATNCMLRIKESKEAARKNIENNFERQYPQKSSNQLLEALALERIGSSSLRNAHEEGDILSASKKSESTPNNNEVDFTGSKESEVFWFDEELRPVSLQTQREAKELRLKQLQIEQEIKQLEQAQENIPSYYYVREIPNKPPPPYTPPGQSVGQSKDQLDPVPTRQEDIESLVTMATHTLYAAYRKGQNVSAIQPSDRFSSKPVGNQVYKKFLFDLVKQIFMNAIDSRYSDEKDTLPWEKTACRVRRLMLPKMTEDCLSNLVSKKVRVLFGFEPSSMKESMIIQWSRKKRDRVDELLVRESQEEEQEWTDYSKCEVAVKNNVAISIFDSILGDTVEALVRVFQKKLKYSQQVL